MIGTNDIGQLYLLRDIVYDIPQNRGKLVDLLDRFMLRSRYNTTCDRSKTPWVCSTEPIAHRLDLLLNAVNAQAPPVRW
jgi:hypothetical protein